MQAAKRVPSLHKSVIPTVTFAESPPDFFIRKVKKMFAWKPFALTAILLMLSAIVAVVMHSRNIHSILLQKGATLQYEGPL
jgi:hypothetical protein